MPRFTVSCHGAGPAPAAAAADGAGASLGELRAWAEQGQLAWGVSITRVSDHLTLPLRKVRSECKWHPVFTCHLFEFTQRYLRPFGEPMLQSQARQGRRTLCFSRSKRVLHAHRLAGLLLPSSSAGCVPFS